MDELYEKVCKASDLVRYSKTFRAPRLKSVNLRKLLRYQHAYPDIVHSALSEAVEAGILSWLRQGNYSLEAEMFPGQDFLNPRFLNVKGDYSRLYFVRREDCVKSANTWLMDRCRTVKHGDYPVNGIPTKRQWREVYVKSSDSHDNLDGELEEKGIIITCVKRLVVPTPKYFSVYYKRNKGKKRPIETLNDFTSDTLANSFIDSFPDHTKRFLFVEEK